MENRPGPKDDAAKKAEAKRHLIFGIVATVVIVGLIAMMFVIDQYGENHMPNAPIQAKGAEDR